MWFGSCRKKVNTDLAANQYLFSINLRSEGASTNFLKKGDQVLKLFDSIIVLGVDKR